jgi:CheY-like chemotaxis protein
VVLKSKTTPVLESDNYSPDVPDVRSICCLFTWCYSRKSLTECGFTADFRRWRCGHTQTIISALITFQLRDKLMIATVWLVEDDVSVRESLGFLLKALDYQVVDFVDLTDFEDATAGARPLRGCLLLDVPLPDINGQNWLAEHTQRHPLLPVIIMADHDTPDAYRHDAFAFFIKPLDMEPLLASIKQAVEESARRVERWHSG